MRQEIQALRAVAVSLVVVYHLWPSSLSGGFVGVDVFFVISGFLITGQLVRGLERSGRVSVGSFWARRARRILPAALVVLAFCVVAVKLVVPETQWEQFFAEIRASIVYVENWHLADAAVDYLRSDDAASPVQHFWSLAVEEQFYLAWPLFLMLGVALGRGHDRTAITAVLGVVTAVSFVYALRAGASNPATAFFSTPARAWEFGAGGLLALVPAARTPRLPRTLGLAGLTAIATAAITYDAGTPFPGVAALLPVLGASAVIASGWAPRPLRARAVQGLGNISYSVYLWHWPLLILAPYALGHDLFPRDRVGLVVLTLAAGLISKVLIEDPFREAKPLARRPARWTLVPAAAATAALLLVASSGTATLERRIDDAVRTAKRTQQQPPPCFGAAVLDGACATREDRVIPDPVAAQKTPNAWCSMERREGLVLPCTFGAARAEASGKVALIGDSHATHWRAALAPVLKARGERGVSLARSHCGYATGTPDLPEPDRSGCMRWRSEVRRWLGRHDDVETAVFAQFAGQGIVTEPGEQRFERLVGAYEQAWSDLPASVRTIVVIRDTPQMLNAGRTLACVERAIGAGDPPGDVCARPKRAALPRDPAAVAAARTTDPRVRLIDMTRSFCWNRTCPPVIGNALVYKDANHFTAVYGATLAPALTRALDAALRST